MFLRNRVTAPFAKHEVQNPPRGIIPDIPVDIKGLAADVSNTYLVLPFTPEIGEVYCLKSTEAGFFCLYFSAVYNFVTRIVYQFKFIIMIFCVYDSRFHAF